MQLDREMKHDLSDEYGDNESGSTATSVLITPTEIYCANLGDSRTVLSKKNGKEYKVQELSIDHKPDNPTEIKRIENAGGRVLNNRVVPGGLGCARALGDYSCKTNEELKPEESVF